MNVAQLETRRDSLQSEYNNVHVKLEQVKASVVLLDQASTKKKKGSKGLVKARLEFMKLNEAFKAIAYELSEVQKSLERFDTLGSRESKVALLIELGERALRAKNTYEDAMDRANDVLFAHSNQDLSIESNQVLQAQIDELAKAYQMTRSIEQEFVQLAQHLAPGLISLEQIETHNSPIKAHQLARDVTELESDLAVKGLDLRLLLKRFGMKPGVAQ